MWRRRPRHFAQCEHETSLRDRTRDKQIKNMLFLSSDWENPAVGLSDCLWSLCTFVSVFNQSFSRIRSWQIGHLRFFPYDGFWYIFLHMFQPKGLILVWGILRLMSMYSYSKQPMNVLWNVPLVPRTVRALYTVIVQMWQSIPFKISLFISRTTRTDFVQLPAAFTGGYVYKIDRLDTKRSFIGAAIEGPTHHLNEKKRSHPEGKLGGKWRGYYIGHPKKLTLTFDLAGLPLRSWSQSSPPTTTTTTTTTTPTVLWPVGR